jgi:hypothetical protein
VRSTPDYIYNLDTSAFLRMKEFYFEEGFPDFWEAMGDLADSGRLIMVKDARDECKDAEVQPWFRKHPSMIIKRTAEVLQCMKVLLGDLDADNQRLVDPNSDKDKADPWVIALAMAENIKHSGSYASGRTIVVGHESLTNKTEGKLKIPDVCKRYSIDYYSLPKVIRIESWKFKRLRFT